METAFPRVVVVDESKRHHLAIVHRTAKKEVHVLCGDCESEYAFPDYMLAAFLERIRHEADTQVVTWVQDDGR